MIIQNMEKNETIEIKVGCDIVEKYVVYREIGTDEVALLECGEREVEEGKKCITFQMVEDEWDSFDEGTPISVVLNYFEDRFQKDNINTSKVVVFDGDNLPSWFQAMLNTGELKVVSIYEFLSMLGYVE